MSNSNYVAAWTNWNTGKIEIVERDIDTGERFITEHNPPYYFYVPDENGEHKSIFGDSVSRLDFESRDEYEAAKQQYPKKFESDISPLNRVLMDSYYDRPSPPVRFVLFDIEVDYKRSMGFAGPVNPYAPINAITVYQSWTNKYITLALVPLVPHPSGVGTILLNKHPDWSEEKFKAEILECAKEYKLGLVPDITICANEIELLSTFCGLIEEADIISGWNSEFYDLPYICERLTLLFGARGAQGLDYKNARKPERKMVNRFGTEEPTYKLHGRSHLDYLRLFQKFTFEGRTSYALANIANEELDVPKIEFDGTLEELYNNNFNLFLIYNIRDVEILKKLDDKFKFIALANQMAHENTVMFDAVLGTVKYVETGIANHAHFKMNRVVHDKVIGNHDKVEGAIVLNPKIGLHEQIGSVDLSSLYPNTARSLNISPEKIVGQFTMKEEAWRDIYEGSDNRHCLILESGEQLILSACEWQVELTKSKWAVSAYGTVFDQGNGRGVIADILGYWYAERKRLQAEKKAWGKKAEALPEGSEKNYALKQEEHFDLLQLTKKISMNSLYGALLNVSFRFGDERMGASITATGRQITTFMIETIGELITGVRHPLIKTTEIDKEGKPHNYYTSESPAIIYGDTDSCYFKTFGTSNEESILIADTVAKETNSKFPEFMRKAFLCQPEFDDKISAGREVVGRRGLFQAKKKYMIKVYDLEGKAVDKMKSMGSEIKKADTPKIIQEFLKTTVDMILDGIDYDTIASFVNVQRKKILKNPNNMFLLGVAKQVNNMDKFLIEYRNPGTLKNSDTGRTIAVPGHVRAALNYNELIQKFDKGSKEIRSGDKVLVYSLKSNMFGFKTIAIPAEMSKLPDWFNDNLKIDIVETEQKMFDNKLGGIFAALGKDIPSPQSVLFNSIVSF